MHLDKRHVKDLDPCAFMPVAPSCTKEPSPVVFGIPSTSIFNSGANITNIPLRRGHDLNLDPRVPAAPSRLTRLTPSQTTSVHRSRNYIRVVRVWSATPHARVSRACTWQREGGNVQRCTCHYTISGERQGAERMHEGTKVNRRCHSHTRSRLHRGVQVVGTTGLKLRASVQVRVLVLVLILMLVLVRMSVRTRVGVSMTVTVRV